MSNCTASINASACLLLFWIANAVRLDRDFGAIDDNNAECLNMESWITYPYCFLRFEVECVTAC